MTVNYYRDSFLYEIYSMAHNYGVNMVDVAQGNGYEAGRLLVERAPQPSPPVIDPEGFMRDIGELVDENMEDGVFNLANLEIANVDYFLTG